MAVGASNESSGSSQQNDNAAVYSGAAYVFSRSASSWTQQAYVKASRPGNGDFFGLAISLSGDGRTMAVGARDEDSAGRGQNSGKESDTGAKNSGAVYVFQRAGEAWQKSSYVKASNTGANDAFGACVALSKNGKNLVVGAPQEDSKGTGVGSGAHGDDSLSGSGAAYALSF